MDVKRVVQGSLGILLVLAGITAAVVGGLLAATFGRDGTLGVESGVLRGDGTALVTENLDIGAGGALQQRLGTLTFGARSESGAPLFIGIAPADAVFTYLGGSPYDVVADVGTSGSTTLRPVPGRTLPPPPAAQGFWTASAQGTRPEFTWPGSGGTDQRLVMMNTDGSRQVAGRLTLEFRSPSVFPIAIGAVVVGVVALVLGVVLIVLAVRAGRRTSVAVLADLPPPSGPPAPGPPAG